MQDDFALGISQLDGWQEQRLCRVLCRRTAGLVPMLHLVGDKTVEQVGHEVRPPLREWSSMVEPCAHQKLSNYHPCRVSCSADEELSSFSIIL